MKVPFSDGSFQITRAFHFHFQRNEFTCPRQRDGVVIFPMLLLLLAMLMRDISLQCPHGTSS